MLEYRMTKIILLLSLMTTSASAAVSDASTEQNIKTCSLRISGSPIEPNTEPIAGQGYCSATLVGPSTLVTAAHCLDDMTDETFGSLRAIHRNQYFYAAFNNADQAQSVLVKPGSSSIFFSGSMDDPDIRRHYATDGDLKLTNHDMVIVQLEKPYKAYDPKLCPHLPTTEDCNTLKESLKSSTASQPLKLQSYFYLTRTTLSERPGGDKSFLPLPNIFPAETQSVYVDPKNDEFVATFTSQSKVIHLRKGDSGSALLMNTDRGPVVVGVESGITSKEGSRSVFAQVCPKIHDARWAQVVGPQNIQQALEAPIKQPLQPNGTTR
jgi:hypothetical protein